MIITLEGKITYLGLNYVILEVSGIGYKVFVNSETLSKIKKDENKKLFVHQYIRENQLDLYGFLNFKELELFELLLSISGIGPKAGLAILSRSKPEAIKKAIIDQNLDLFTAVSGIGKKMAIKIILELKERVSAEDLSIISKAGDFSETLEALKNLGYKTFEIRTILNQIPQNIKLPEEQIRWALKKLGK